MQVLILGYGEMGHAMETLLASRHDLAIWDKYPPPGLVPDRLEATAPTADVVLFCLPASPHREVLEHVRPLLKPGSIGISIAKGLDDEGLTAQDNLESVFGDAHEFGLVYGPMIAEDIRAGRRGFAQAGCRTTATFERLESLYRGSALHLVHTRDLDGITWAVVMKNVYAIGFGIIDELGMGDNMRGFLMVQALRELSRIVVDKGGEPGTPYELAGLGDLVTTATSAGSHHHALGRKLARGETDDITGEGIHSLAMASEHGLIDIKRHPLLAAIHGIVRKPRRARTILEDYVRASFGE